MIISITKKCKLFAQRDTFTDSDLRTCFYLLSVSQECCIAFSSAGHDRIGGFVACLVLLATGYNLNGRVFEKCAYKKLMDKPLETIGVNER